jgi:hypothetical protein
MGTAQEGHGQFVGSLCHCTAGLPHWGQNFASWNIMPKQDGQEMPARRAPQWAQLGASPATAAPQL